MNERGIAFSGEKIRLMQAMFARGETVVQTRRVWKTQPPGLVTSVEQWADGLWRIEHEQAGNHVGLRIKCPYQVGQILYAREGYKVTHAFRSTMDISPINIGFLLVQPDPDDQDRPKHSKVARVVLKGRYTADDQSFTKDLTREETRKFLARKFWYRPSPARFMYKSLARYRFEVLEIRGQQLQEISKKDAIQEGITWSEAFPEGYTYGTPTGYGSAVGAFASLWDSINAARGYPWESNPWLFAYTLRLLG